MNLVRLSLFPLLLLLAPGAVIAHEYWITPEAQLAEEGSAIAVTICQGHDFPLCEAFESADTFTGLHVTGPDGKSLQLDVSTAADGATVAEWTAASAGRHALSVQMVMSHPRRGEIPLYTTRTEIRVPGGGVQQYPAGLGRGLEIFLVEDVAAGEGSDRITLRATNNGQPAQAALQIHPEGGRKYSLNADRSGEASLRRPPPGRYLVYTSFQGVSGSLSFTIPAE